MFIQCLIQLIDEEALKRFGDYSKFSRVAFEDYSNPAGAWRAVRNPRKNGKARALGMDDLLSISRALDMPLSVLFFQTEQRIKLGWKPEADVKLPPRKTTIKQEKEALPGSRAALPADIEKV